MAKPGNVKIEVETTLKEGWGMKCHVMHIGPDGCEYPVEILAAAVPHVFDRLRFLSGNVVVTGVVETVNHCFVNGRHGVQVRMDQDTVELAAAESADIPLEPLPANAAELLRSLNLEFYGGPKAHADVFRILPLVADHLERMQ